MIAKAEPAQYANKPMSRRVICLCPGGVATGGPEALHQLCDAINRLGGEAAMLYSPDDSIGRHRSYEKYSSPSIKISDIEVDDFLVFPEPWHRQVIPEFDSAIWWLAVPKDHEDVAKAKVAFHFCQSEFAKHVLLSHGIEGVMLSDYTDEVFRISHMGRGNSISGNPAKGFNFSQLFVSQSKIPISYLHGLDKQQMSNELNKSKVYIEFGHNPGKDRIPREAAKCGNVVFMNRVGAGCCYNDYQIDEWFTFDNSNFEELIEKVNLVFDDYEHYYSKQNHFLEVLSREAQVFDKQVTHMMSLIDSL